MEILGPASEVQAVSELLAAIGEDPVEDLENLPPSGNTALAALRSTSRDLQEEGHWFNYEPDYVLTPNEDGEIILPDDILSVHGVDDVYVERRPRLYDVANKTYTIGRQITCGVIWHLSWDELPSVARRYVTAMAVERFVDGLPGAQAVTEARHRNYVRAKVAFDKAVIRNGRLNLLNNNSILQASRRS